MKYHIIFCILWLFIAAVSSYDLFLLIKFRDVIHEQNPLGAWLIKYYNDVSLFAGLKMFGTTIALGILSIIYYNNESKGLLIASVVSLFQSWLLYYLSFC